MQQAQLAGPTSARSALPVLPPAPGDASNPPDDADPATLEFLGMITNEIFASGDLLSDGVLSADSLHREGHSKSRYYHDLVSLFYGFLETDRVPECLTILQRLFVGDPESTATGPWRDPRLHYAVLNHLLFTKENWSDAWAWYSLSVGRRELKVSRDSFLRLGIEDYGILEPVRHGSFVLGLVARGTARAYQRSKWDSRDPLDVVLRAVEILISDIQRIFGSSEDWIWSEVFRTESTVEEVKEGSDWAVFREAAGKVGIILPQVLPHLVQESEVGPQSTHKSVSRSKREVITLFLTRPSHAHAHAHALARQSIGLTLLRELLSTFSNDPSPLSQAQLNLESSVKAMSEFESQLRSEKLKAAGVVRGTGLGRLMWEWHGLLMPELKRDLPGRKVRYNTEFIDLLKQVDVETLSSVTIVETLRAIQTSGLTVLEQWNAEIGTRDEESVPAVALVNICGRIGRAVELEHGLNLLREAHLSGSKVVEVLNKAAKSRADMSSLATVREAIFRHEEQLGSGRGRRWTAVMQFKVGAYLLDRFVEVAKINVPSGKTMKAQRAFETALVKHKGQEKGLTILKIRDGMQTYLEDGTLSGEPVYLPMLVPPKPWIRFESGGYFTIPIEAVRIKPSDLDPYQLVKKADELGMLSQLYAGLDVLGSQSWRVNDKVLEVACKIWEGGEPLGGLPSGNPLPIPKEPNPKEYEALGPQEYYRLKDAHKRAAKEELERYSLRCSENYALEVAKAFSGRTIYFPHNTDFRGRAYPIPTHLNHMRNDMARGLLVFAEAKPLGPDGLNWLFIHIANLCGINKLTLPERRKWTEDRLEDIFDSADKPLDGRRWWIDSEKPFQCLAACIELTNALRHPEGPESYLSNLPVHQDGTCNGLQHYAALGGDYEGARQVNVVAGPKPADVYMGVADVVAKLVDEDYARAVRYEAETGEKPTDPAMVAATLMHGKITRKLIKQTVMTNTYGVTLIGARDQIRNRLKESRGKEHDMSIDQMGKCALYLAQKTFEALGQTFEGAKRLQVWMNETARIIATSINPMHLQKEDMVRAAVVQRMGLLVGKRNVARTGYDVPAFAESESEESASGDEEAVKEAAEEPEDGVVPLALNNAEERQRAGGLKQAVAWTSPIGLPIMQPYRQLHGSRVRTSLAQISILDPHKPGEINSRKQATAFPPNYVHSLDATHMFYTAMSMKKEGLAFASVHDSFWTHAADVSAMGRIIREEFARLHNGGEVLKNLREELVARYSGQVSLIRLHMTREQLQAVENDVAQIMGRKPRNMRGRTINEKVPGINVAPEGEKPTTAMEVWLPLHIPDLPRRGEFDINLVLESTYFFH